MFLKEELRFLFVYFGFLVEFFFFQLRGHIHIKENNVLLELRPRYQEYILFGGRGLCVTVWFCSHTKQRVRVAPKSWRMLAFP